MLRELPSGRTWTTKRRDAFLNAFKAMLDFTIVVDDDPRSQLPASWTTEDSPEQEVMQ
jgi:hypothetical protein